jgi:hypothetical protein
MIAVTTPTRSTHNSFFVVRQLLLRCLADSHVITDRPDDADLHIHVGTPEERQRDFYASPKHKLIFYSVTEAPDIPLDWVRVYNRCLEVWVPSVFCLETFERCGVTAPLRLIPHGIDCASLSSTNGGQANGVFTVQWQGIVQKRILPDGETVDGDRKRGYLVERAFRKAALPNSRLIVKSLPREAPAYDVRAGSVWYVSRSLGTREMAILDRDVDLFVWPTMGEGFGLVPLEKMARGISVAVPDWSGLTEYLPYFPVEKLAHDFVDVEYNGVATRMADVAEETIVACLRSAYERKEELRARRETLMTIARTHWDFRVRMKPLVCAAVRALLGSR